MAARALDKEMARSLEEMRMEIADVAAKMDEHLARQDEILA
jgi:hypothetical protein